MHFAYARIPFLEWSTLTYPFGLGAVAKALPRGPSANRLAGIRAKAMIVCIELMETTF
jgi:hypothetical protein